MLAGLKRQNRCQAAVTMLALTSDDKPPG